MAAKPKSFVKKIIEFFFHSIIMHIYSDSTES